MERDSFDAVGGFNERMSGWGFDDKDLRARLVMQFGAQVKTLPPGALQAIHHSDSVRVGGRLGQPIKAFARHQALAALRASRLNNRMVAAECPWGRTSIATQYRLVSGPPSDSVWCADEATIPQLPLSVDRSLRQQRRRTFGTCCWRFLMQRWSSCRSSCFPLIVLVSGRCGGGIGCIGPRSVGCCCFQL